VHRGKSPLGRWGRSLRWQLLVKCQRCLVNSFWNKTQVLRLVLRHWRLVMPTLMFPAVRPRPRYLSRPLLGGMRPWVHSHRWGAARLKRIVGY